MVEPQDPLLGNTLGSCRLEVRLATGGMGTVYRAHSLKLAKDVAVKILAPSLATDPEYVERFQREARAASSINHPNIVKVYDFGKDQERWYMVLEYVRGQTLGDLVFDKGRLSLEMATRIARDLAKGLEAAHRAGIIHRDVKPHNVLMTHDLTPKLTDFGLVRTGTRPSGITMEGVFMGTPEYVAPEQAEGRKVDARSDLYSLGVTYYQMLSGQLPFFGKTAMEMAMARLKEDPRPIENAAPGVDPRAAAVIAKLLKRSPLERYQSATELVKDLEAILVGKAPTSAKPPVDEESRKFVKVGLGAKRKLRAASFLLLFLLSMGCFTALGAIASPAARAEGDYWRGLAAAVRVDPSQPGLREGFLLGGVLALAGALFIFRRELAGCGRGWQIAFLLLLAVACACAGTAYLDGARGNGADLVTSAAKALGSALLRPVHLLLASVALLVLGVGLSWPREAGENRYVAYRLMLLAAFGLLYVFAVGRDLGAPLRSFSRAYHYLVPIGTLTLVAIGFGTELSVGFRHTGGARAFGLFLVVFAFVGMVVFGLVATRPSMDNIDWPRMLMQPILDFAASFRAQAGPLGVSYVLLALAAMLYVGGQARVSRKGA
jgi:hypothetical protein